MFSSAELIEALRRRMRRSLRPPPPPGEFPPGWRDWFAAMSVQPGRMTGAGADEVIAVVAAREPVPPQGLVEQLGRWRAFASLWRQDWQPASRDERWTRVAAMSGSLLLHLLFAVAMLWLLLFRPPFAARAEADARSGEEHVLQVEYIGEGTPADAEGGGAPDAPTDLPEPQAAAAASPVPPSAQPPSPPSAPVPAPAREAAAAADVVPAPPLPVPEPAIEPPVPAPQTLQVTEVAVPDSRHVVPPPREAEVRAPRAATAEVAVRQREIELAESVTRATPSLRTPQTAVAAPRTPSPTVAVSDREVQLAATAEPEVRLRPAPGAPAVAVPGPRAAAPAARNRDVPMPESRATAAEPASTQVTAPAARDGGATPSTAPPSGQPAAQAGARGTTPAPGAGPRPGQLPGAQPSQVAADDWGDSTRDAPGGQAGAASASGLFDGDGRPRLADGGRVGGGLPPGTVTEDFENVDRHGTWLKRPPYDYEPTSFDRFWMPSETLLEEWVRKSVSEVRIPIPGTTKSIRCVTVMLALGGACDIVDPNLQEQPARARKPPDVPFKRDLIEDQGALGPPPPES